MVPVLWTYYKAKDGLFPVRLRSTSTVDGKTKVTYLDTGIRIEKRQFVGGMVRNHPDAQAFNLKIMALCSRADGHKSYLEWFRDFIDKPHGYYHKRKLQGVYNILKDRNPRLTLEFIMRLERDFTSEGKHPNYIASIFKCMRSVVALMVKAGELEYHQNPFLHYKIKTVKSDRLRVTIDEIRALEKAALRKRQGLARDMYLVSFYQGGIRFGDLCRLAKENVVDGRLIYTMNKTSRERNLPLNIVSERVLKRYKYQFPLDIDWKNESKSINAKNTLMNKHLKLACKAAGIPEITFHTSRHSITDHAVKNKRTLIEIQGILGHSRASTTEAYLKGFYREETDSALEQLFSSGKNEKGV